MYWQGTSSISNCLNRLLHDILGFTPTVILTIFFCKVKIFPLSKGKGKAIPLQAWTGPEGFTRLRLPDFKTIGTWRQ